MKKNLSKFIRISVLVVLIAATALFVLSCSKDKGETPAGTDNTAGITITVEVINSAGTSTEHSVTTTATNLGDALLESGIAEGSVEEYGLYITTVDGETADWNTDQAYWALSKDGEYLMTGASDTPIADGEHYELTYTKG